MTTVRSEGIAMATHAVGIIYTVQEAHTVNVSLLLICVLIFSVYFDLANVLGVTI